MTATTTSRTAQINHIATHLVPQASLVTRLLVKQSRHDMSRTDGGVLRTLASGPRRISELAELEGLAQPTMTLLVKRLEERGWLERRRDPGDGRAVLVALSADGKAALDELRAHYRALLRERLAGMSDAQVAALETATNALADLVEVLQSGGAN